MRLKLFVLSIAISAPLFLFGQIKYASQDKKALKYYEEAKQLLRRVQFSESLIPLQKAVERDPQFIEAWKAKGSAHQRLSQMKPAILAYKQSIEIDTEYHRSIETYFSLGKILYDSGNYEESLRYFVEYTRRSPGNPKNEEIANHYAQSIRFALKAIENPLPYNPTVLPDAVNEFKLQYFPVLTVDQQSIFFTARKGVKLTFDEDLYVANRDSSGVWGNPVSISTKINSPYNEGACSISADGRMLIFTACNGRNGFGNCDLYVARKSGDEWNKPVNMGGEVNSPSWEAQPTLSADGRTLYFVSNRPGGNGGKDIWVSKAVSRDKWSTPENLGSTVNTTKDDISPFIHVNGESLYFSSTGHVGMGGYDIFLSEKIDSTWSTPRNLGYPLNDRLDQVSLYITSDGAKGYYTVEENSGYDLSSKLYSFDIPPPLRIRHSSAYLIGQIKDGVSDKPLGAVVQLYSQEDAVLVSSVSSDKISGEYTLVLTEGHRYGIYVGKKGYMFKDFSLDYSGVEDFDSGVLDIDLFPIETGASQALNNIYFDVNSYELKPESYSELNFIAKFLRINRTVVIQINGHTDATGTEKYNYELSLNRAHAVYDYLEKKRIPKSRMTFKGFGSQKPILPNANESERSKNRRIEFGIVKF